MAKRPNPSTDDLPTPAAPFDFEASMKELEGVVTRLEQPDVPLEEALAAFERGVALTRACRDALEAAEQKVELLSRGADGVGVAVPFDVDDE